MTNKTYLFENEFLQIEMITPNYPFIHVKKKGAVIIPYDVNGNIYLMHRNRPSIGEGYEAPRGFVENGETYKVGALRELKEETGMEVSKVKSLGYLQPDTGVTNNKIEVFAVLVEESTLDYEHKDSDGSEVYKVTKVDNKMLKTLILDGSIYCGLTLAAIQKYCAFFS